jgi:GTP-binding protein
MTESAPPESDCGAARRQDIRNVAIIAHVDHGKTTLVDRLLHICGAFREGQEVRDCVLDSGSLERERGITILAKNTSVTWKDVTVNLVDTPGHADFGGEVERTLRMADGCLLLVDAAEGPLPQTRFVLQKALETGLAPVIVINKCDRKDARADEVLNEIYDLFIDLDASEDQLEFPVLYGSGRDGWMASSPEGPKESIAPLLDAVLEHVPGPLAERDAPLRMLVASLAHDDFVGRIALGRVVAGALAEGDDVLLIKPDGSEHKRQVRGLYAFRSLGRERMERVEAGDIAAVVGLEGVDIGDSVTCPVEPRPLEPITVEPPTLTMMFLASDSPFRGQEGSLVTSRQLRERLDKELERNVALQVTPTEDAGCMKVSGRGLLHLGVLLETMRREGFEVQVSKPEVIVTRDENDKLQEPHEHLVVDVPDAYSGKVIEAVGSRRGELLKMDQGPAGARLEFRIPARGLMGLALRLLQLSSGEAAAHHVFSGYAPWRGEIAGRTAGVLVAMAAGTATGYALSSLEDRGTFFIAPGDRVYEGMVVGEHCKPGDLVVNVTRKKGLTNVRAAGSDEKVTLAPPRRFTIEEALEYIEPDELVEITPGSVRLRKRLLNEKERKRARNSAVDRQAARAGRS